jgi:Cu/Ag efflux protein CusF
MMRLPSVRLGIALMFLVALASIASAEEAKGTVKSVNAEKAHLVIKGILNDTTYDLNKDAKLCLDGKKAKLADLREGDHVTIEYMKAGDNRLMAAEVRALRKATETTGTVRGAVSEKHELILKGILRDTTYQLEKDATIWINGKEGKLADLREGDQVRLTFEQRGDQNMASEVTMLRK